MVVVIIEQVANGADDQGHSYGKLFDNVGLATVSLVQDGFKSRNPHYFTKYNGFHDELEARIVEIIS